VWPIEERPCRERSCPARSQPDAAVPDQAARVRAQLPEVPDDLIDSRRTARRATSRSESVTP
jgi:hypothetical protein